LSGANIHATALTVGELGILITGPSGSGKSTLAAALSAAAHARGLTSFLVGDDRILLRAAGGRLVAAPTDNLAGLTEVFGLGIRRVPFLPAAIIDLVVSLVPPETIERMPEPAKTKLQDLAVSHLSVPARCSGRAVDIVLSWTASKPLEQ